jgi:IS30 family transposase
LRPKRCLLAVNRKLRDIVASKLILDWSPEQISGWLKIRYPQPNQLMRTNKRAGKRAGKQKPSVSSATFLVTTSEQMK